ncbi:SRPBCC family protein [Alkalihalobacillus deserti]|uniref:SRPBCC family protein n=1 Tax=Alkalihalobacillus deserti TaxID=2879466 RepID=UPI001D1432E1|nr:SRPBCC family protein [Alkalihalobacillus deserti]
MTSFVYTYQTIINAPIEDVWSFFSSATNLSKITSFPKIEVTSDLRTMEGNKMEMKLGFAGVRMKWISLIHDVDAPTQFVDTGIKLPFPFTEWKHIHAFTSQGNQTVMDDQVRCSTVLPSFMVKPLVNNMFKGREQAIKLHFTK